MVLRSNVDIGSCVAAQITGPSRIDCSHGDGKNYCCTNPNGLLLNTTSRICCTYEDYADQHWAIIAAIRCELIILTILFAIIIISLFGLWLWSLSISEEDIKASRRIIIRELMKRQLLYKSKETLRPSAITSLQKLSNKLSGSLPERASKVTDQKQRPAVSRH